MSTNDLIAAGTVAGAAFLGAAALFTWIELRRGARARETALLLELAFRWLDPWFAESLSQSDKETVDSLRSLLETVQAGNETDAESERWLLLTRAPNFLEQVGYLERRRSAIKIADVEGFWGSQVLRLWRLWEPSIPTLRNRSDTVLLEFETIATKVRRFRERRVKRERIRALLRSLLPGLPRG